MRADKLKGTIHWLTAASAHAPPQTLDFRARTPTEAHTSTRTASRRTLWFRREYRLTLLSGSSITSLASESAPAGKLSGRKTRKNSAREEFIGEYVLYQQSNKCHYPQISSPLPTVHCHKVKHRNMIFVVVVIVVFCLLARTERLKPKNQHEAWRWCWWWWW